MPTSPAFPPAASSAPGLLALPGLLEALDTWDLGGLVDEAGGAEEQPKGAKDAPSPTPSPRLARTDSLEELVMKVRGGQGGSRYGRSWRDGI